MNKILIRILRTLFFIAIGVGLFYLAFRGTDLTFDSIKKSLQEDIHFFWIILSMIIGLLSHVSRSIRWRMLIKSLDYKPKLYSVFFGTMIMYFSNLAIPRSGEIVRCGIVNKYEKIPFSKLVGTVIIERAIDFLALFSLTFIVLITQFPVVKKIFSFNAVSNPESSGNNMLNIGLYLLIALGIAVFILIIFWKKIKTTLIYKKIADMIKNIIEGIISIKQLDNKFWFIFHTIFIWVCYFIMFYICFFAFDFTKEYGILIGMTLFVMASYGMVAPSPGGIGPWHFMIIHTLLIYMVADYSITDYYNDLLYAKTERQQAGLFALIVHGTQTIMLIVAGFLSYLLLPVFSKKYKKTKNPIATNE